jgi:hypothetical protein
MKEEVRDEILKGSYQKGKPEKPLDWLKKLQGKEEIIRFIKTAERYWYGESYGSEKRRSPA